MSFATNYLYRSDSDRQIRWHRVGEQFVDLHGRIWTKAPESEVARNHRWWVACIKGVFALIISITETIRFGANLGVHGSYFLQDRLYMDNMIVDIVSLIFFNLIAAPFMLISWAALLVGSVPYFIGANIDWMENNGYCGALWDDFQKT